MEIASSSLARRLLGPEPQDGPGHLWPRWLFLRALGLTFLSAFYSLSFQIRGLIGPEGILPAGQYLEQVARHLGPLRFWFAPTLLWLGSGPLALEVLCVVGLVASILLVANFWPRMMSAVCIVAFLSFVSAAQDFSSYQSDGMLLAAGFLALFFAPPGLRPRLGDRHPPSRASLFLVQWLWFRIYFESGLAKIGGGDPEWRNLTAMDHYYENGPLPNWIGWYVQQLPHWFHASFALLTLVIELGVVWMLFLPRRFRIVCFFIATAFQIGIIFTANLTFLNHFVLALGILLLDDKFLRSVFPWLKSKFENRPSAGGAGLQTPDSALRHPWPPLFGHLSLVTRRLSLLVSGFFLGWIFYATTVLLLLMMFPRLPLPLAPVQILEPFRFANQYGLFGVMTRARHEIEFQGTRDGQTWIPYPFRYKPQDPRQPPRIHAPYQPRFDWNLWFASLGPWRQYPFVVRTEALLLQNDGSVLALFAGNPFPGDPPRQVRAVLWQYWFTDLATRRAQGLWWRRELRGLYAPTLEREPDGEIVAVEPPEPNVPPTTPEP